MITIMIIYIAYLMGISECKLVGSFPINAPSSQHRRFDFQIPNFLMKVLFVFKRFLMHLLSNIVRCIVWFDIDWKIPENFSTKGVSWHGRRVSGISLGDLLMQILFTAHTQLIFETCASTVGYIIIEKSYTNDSTVASVRFFNFNIILQLFYRITDVFMEENDKCDVCPHIF